MQRIYEIGGNKLKIFSTASLIQRFYEGCPLDEIYNKGIGCYEVLLHLLENPEGTYRISEITKLSPEKINTAAVKIVRLMLFNKENNPFLSLGLSDHVTVKDIKKRWKGLLMLFHPDRSLNKKAYEEMTKKINQAYSDIGKYGANSFFYEKVAHNDTEKIREKTPGSFSSGINLNKSPYRIYNFKYFKYLPAFILISVISLAILTIVFFIIQK